MTMITVIGKLTDTAKYAGLEGYNVLLESTTWTPEKNRQWIDRAVERGDLFLIVSHDVSGQFEIELEYLVRKLKGNDNDIQSS